MTLRPESKQYLLGWRLWSNLTGPLELHTRYRTARDVQSQVTNQLNTMHPTNIQIRKLENLQGSKLRT